jgi:DNA-binding transcriptional ArsR family regulator
MLASFQAISFYGYIVNMRSRALPLSEQMVELVARRFRMLGEPQRLRILQVLEGGEKTVGEIVETLEGNQPNISKHLQALNDAGLVGRRREGNSIFYAIADPVVFKLCELVCRSAIEEARGRLESLAGIEQPVAKRSKR